MGSKSGDGKREGIFSTLSICNLLSNLCLTSVSVAALNSWQLMSGQETSNGHALFYFGRESQYQHTFLCPDCLSTFINYSEKKQKRKNYTKEKKKWERREKIGKTKEWTATAIYRMVTLYAYIHVANIQELALCPPKMAFKKLLANHSFCLLSKPTVTCIG